MFFFMSILSYKYSYSQSILSFGSSGVQHEDTLHIGDTIHFSFWLINEGSININDSISMSCETFDIIGNPISSMGIGDIYNTVGSLAIGDSIFVSIEEVVTYFSYVLGDNIVVIWPAFIGLGDSDTSTTYVHILDNPSAEYELEIKNSELNIFPNPSSGNIYIEHKINTEEFSIYITDYFGNILFTKDQIDTNNSIFNVRELTQGMYFLVFSFNDRQITRKIIVN